MSTKALIVVFAATTLATISACTADSARTSNNEERPPIIVKGGSVILEIDAGSKNWKGQNKTWQPDHDNGKPLWVYVVTVEQEGSDRPRCGPFVGEEVLITIGEDQPLFRFDRPRKQVIGKREPRVKSRFDLHVDSNNPWTLRTTEVGTVEGLKVSVTTGSCIVPDGHLIRIRPQG